jgi:hypothetical protein
MQIKLFNFNNFISIIALFALLKDFMQIKSADCGSNLHFLTLGLPQILICGKSGGNGRTYDLAERYRSCDPLAERVRAYLFISRVRAKEQHQRPNHIAEGPRIWRVILVLAIKAISLYMPRTKRRLAW